ncbi:MAG: hypothetical protein JWQ76_2844 [Ramlibacter sp.]|nr:hypothetical protein [Ramlibacter sp.]
MTGPKQAWGLGLASNLPLEALSGSVPASRVDVAILFDVLPAADLAVPRWQERYRSPDRNQDGTYNVRAAWNADSRLHRLQYYDGVDILLDDTGSNVWASRRPGYPLEDAGVYLLGPAMGFLLRLRGTLCLHASCAVIDGRAVAFIGPSGAGKSTAAGAFACAGLPILTDDVLALRLERGSVEALPAYPRVRLWPESAQGLFGDPQALPVITAGWNKRYLDLRAPGFAFHETPAPLKVVYLLEEHARADVVIEDMSGHEAFLALAANVYASKFVDTERRAQEFDSAAQLARTVRVKRVRRPYDFRRLHAFRDAIRNDVGA